MFAADINHHEESIINLISPNILSCSQQQDRLQKIEFLEVDVTTNSDTKRSYLLERKTRISCDEIDPAGPQEKHVPLAALDKLVIEGYSARIQLGNDESKCVPTVCPAEKKCPKNKRSEK